ncbi:MAG: phosphoglycerate mutase family protein [Bacteroidales bacterium]|jgi:broad specificity phosphatase PhoE|nr:phosphoglycerate mutase family protein [Bacteroidales bacterium]
MLPQIHKHYSENDKISLLIRHADRDKIPTGEFGNDVLLNEKGKEKALSFGESLLELKINKIFTSPVQRCVQTAKYIAKGYGKPLEITQSHELGNPGLHISDDQTAGKFFLTEGFDELYYRITHNIDIPGISVTKEFNANMTNFLIENTKENGLTIFVTHDLLIAHYHFSINGKIYPKDDWVKYLDGLILKNGRYEE